VAKLLRLRLGGDSRSALPFEYLDKGSMAVIGRRRAVAQVWKLRLSGLFAWFAWLFIHVLYLAEFQNRVLVMIQWGWNFVTRNRAARLITGDLAPRASKQTPAERVKASGAASPG
jgi:NADH dehydrogenase